jgi:uncharacterized protein with FMN-binding domain
MLRAAAILTGTAAGLAALLSFKSHPATIAAAPPEAPPVTSQATASPAPTPAASSHPAASKSPAAAGKSSAAASKSPAAAGKGSAAPTTPTTPAAPTTQAAPTTPAAPAARTLTGTVANTQYGPMQVQVTLTGQKITNVTVLQRTDAGAESDQIDANAIPKLNSETLAAQSAQISAVSGASYTSQGYIQSLQSALDQA